MLVARDISERKQMEASLQANERRYRQIVETAREGVWVIDSDNRTTLVNDAMAKMLGYTTEEMVGQSLFAFMDEEGRAICTRNIERRRSGIKEDHEFKLKHRDGADVWVLMSTAPLFSEHGQYTGAVAFVMDLSERRELEAQLLQAQKLEALGRLAGGIAHDFNNLLTVIRGYALLSSEQLDDHESLRTNLNEILEACQRAATLTHQLLTFSRKNVARPTVVDLNRIVTSMVQLLRRLLGQHIELRTNLQPLSGRLKIDRGHLDQVIMNLAANARDAMPDGGILTIETASVSLTAAEASRLANVAPGSYLRLSVTDTGRGMDATVKAHLFEPFFTTKPVGKGTGLGMSAVYGIVKQSSGHIFVNSEVGQGTRVDLYFPQTDEPEAMEDNPVLGTRMPEGHETILLIEDEVAVRNLCRAMLQHLGYTVLEASSPSHALFLLQHYEGTVHLAVIDVIMPEMKGQELSGRLLAIRPTLKVLYMSSYTDLAIVRDGVMEKGFAFLQKPFHPWDLARKVREVLDTTDTR